MKAYQMIYTACGKTKNGDYDVWGHSSALDYKTDSALRRALAEELGDSTVITVAQRVSSVKSCDLILVIDEGRIIGRGSHEELLESCEEYREISQSQMGGAFLD